MPSLKLSINKSIIVDQIAMVLSSFKKVPYNVEITDITFEDINKPIVNLTVHFKKEELEVTYFDTDVTSQPSKRS